MSGAKLPRVEFWTEPVDRPSEDQGDTLIAVHITRAWDVPCRYSTFLIVPAVKWWVHSQRKQLQADLLKRLHDLETDLFHFYGGKRFVQQFSYHAENGGLWWGSLHGDGACRNVD